MSIWKQAAIFFSSMAFGLAVFSIVYTRAGLTPSPELRAIVHQICPAGGQPFEHAGFGHQIGLWYASEIITANPFQHIWFCAIGMWK